MSCVFPIVVKPVLPHAEFGPSGRRTPLYFNHFNIYIFIRTLRLWDLRKPTCAGVMEVGQSAVGCFDPEGIIFAAGVDSETIKLYDLR